MTYKEKLNKERLSFSLVLKDKKDFDRLKLLFKTELSCVINMLDEGSFSRQEVSHFVVQNETSSSKSFYDYLLLFQFNTALDYIFENYKKITIDDAFVVKLHKMLFERIEKDAGCYRKSKFQYNGLKLKSADFNLVFDEVEKLFSSLKEKRLPSLDKIFDTHYTFLTIAPFKKGNFQIAFLLLMTLLLKNGYCPLILRTIDKKRYFELLELYQSKGRVDSYHSFMRQALGRSFQLLFNDGAGTVENKDLLTISKFAEACNVPVSTVRYWMKEGQIKPVVFSRAGYALFSKEQRIDLQETKLNKMITKCMNTLKKGVEKSINQV